MAIAASKGLAAFFGAAVVYDAAPFALVQAIRFRHLDVSY